MATWPEHMSDRSGNTQPSFKFAYQMHYYLVYSEGEELVTHSACDPRDLVLSEASSYGFGRTRFEMLANI